MKFKNKTGKGLTITAYSICIIFAIIVLFPLSYMVGNSLKSDDALYEVPPKIIPSPAYSTSVIIDYSQVSSLGNEELKDIILKDAILTTYTIPYYIKDEGIYDIKVYALKDDKVIYYSRAHKMKLGLELDYGIYKSVTPNTTAMARDNKYRKAADELNYKFDLQGINEEYNKELISDSDFNQKVNKLISTDHPIHGKFVGATKQNNNWLMLENFVYYYELPTYAYANNETISKYSFFSFMGNTSLVIGWAILIQIILCSLTAFALSKLFSKKTASIILIFFLGTMMIPFVSIMVPQLQMFQELGLYNNYGALLMPFLLPYAYYIYLCKGFFDQIPNELFEAARVDGASEVFCYLRICIPLSKPILSLIGLTVFLSNWNDFFWAWLVTEKQELWTLNVALYNLSQSNNINQNFLMGLSVVSLIPIIIVTVIFSEQIKRSIASTGIKG